MLEDSPEVHVLEAVAETVDMDSVIVEAAGRGYWELIVSKDLPVHSVVWNGMLTRRRTEKISRSLWKGVGCLRAEEG